MLIVCPSCASSYMIDPAAVGPAGRTVRCARCKASWFAGGPKADPDVATFVDSVIAEAEGKLPARLRAGSLPSASAITLSTKVATSGSALGPPANQLALQRAQRTVRPAGPTAAGSIM